MIDQWFSDTFPGSVVAHDTLICGSRHDPEPADRCGRTCHSAVAGDDHSEPRIARDRAARPHHPQVETDEGVLGDQANAIVPVEILCV